MFKRILVPVDGSRHSRRAVEVAGDMAQYSGAEVWLLHVIRDLSLPREILEMIAAGEVTESRRELLENSAEIILDNAREALAKKGVEAQRAEYVFGPPAKTIARYAGEKGVDLIVFGAQGLDTQGPILGGVARKLTNIAPVSCLLVR
ncbi:MAG: universal stress protein [Chloroflexi bacterium]|nr:universal stress protein [Chloroflexota bacterium]